MSLETLNCNESESELARIDRKWQTEREQYMVRSRWGQLYEPRTEAAIFMGVIAVVAGLLCVVFTLIMAANFGAPLLLLMPAGLLLLVGGLAVSMYQYSKAQRYQNAQAGYERRREKALDDSRRMRE